MIQIRNNPDEFDFKFIHDSLLTTYWAADRTYIGVEKSFRHSLSKMLYRDNIPVGFARVVTDYAVFAYIADVFIAEKYRHQGLGQILIESLIHDPALAEIKKWMLVTSDMHELYKKYGFTQLKHPERSMEFFPVNTEQ